MLQTITQKEVRDVLRKFSRAASYLRPDDGEETTIAGLDMPAEAERWATYASTCLTAVMSNDASETVLFKVIIDPRSERECDDMDMAWQAEQVSDTEINLYLYRMHPEVMSAPEHMRCFVFLYSAVSQYVQFVETVCPNHKWGVKNPVETITLEALFDITPEQRTAARRSVFC